MHNYKKHKYYTKDVFLAVLGVVKTVPGGRFLCDGEQIIRNKVFVIKSKNYDSCGECIDIRTGTKYEDFHNQVVIDYAVGKVLYHHLYPASHWINEDKVTRELLLVAEDKINGLIKKEPVEEEIPDKTGISFLDNLMGYIPKLENIKSSEEKERLKQEIMNIAMYYVSELMKIKMMAKDHNLKSSDPEDELNNEMFIKLNNLDEEITKAESNDKLIEGINILKRNLEK